MFLRNPLKRIAESSPEPTKSIPNIVILIDGLDENKDCKVIELLKDLDGIHKGLCNFIVTTREDQNILSKLTSHWDGERYKKFLPSDLTGLYSPLLIHLQEKIKAKNQNDTTPTDLYDAYSQLIDLAIDQPYKKVLMVMIASFRPQSESNLMAMELLDEAKTLPEDWFEVKEHKWYFRHRSLKEWFLDKTSWGKEGHELLAEFIWKTILEPWLIPQQHIPEKAPASGSYFLLFALLHLKEANRQEDIKHIIFQQPWQQTMLNEKGLENLMEEIENLNILSDNDKTKLFFQLKSRHRSNEGVLDEIVLLDK
eukprot:gene38792-50989_t